MTRHLSLSLVPVGNANRNPTCSIIHRCDWRYPAPVLERSVLNDNAGRLDFDGVVRQLEHGIFVAGIVDGADGARTAAAARRSH